MDEVLRDNWVYSRWMAPLNETRRLRLEMRRGRNFARRGLVGGLQVQAGIVKAQVSTDTGSKHDVQIRMDRIEDEIWDAALDRIAARAALAADLLQGRLSLELAAVFEECGHDLFPFDLRDLSNWCTCRQDSDVCTHAVATHFEFARLLVTDPLALLELRGRSRQWLFEALRARRGGSGGGGARPSSEDASREPYEVVAQGFWARGVVPHLAFRLGRGELGEDEFLPVLRALGPGPAETDPEPIVRVLAPLMRAGLRRVDAIVERAEEEADAPDEAPDVDVAGADSLDELLIAAVHQHGVLTSGFVAEALGITPREARRYLQWLVEEGRLRVEGRARGTRYLLADSPREGAAVGEATEAREAS